MFFFVTSVFDKRLVIFVYHKYICNSDYCLCTCIVYRTSVVVYNYISNRSYIYICGKRKCQHACYTYNTYKLTLKLNMKLKSHTCVLVQHTITLSFFLIYFIHLLFAFLGPSNRVNIFIHNIHYTM